MFNCILNIIVYRYTYNVIRITFISIRFIIHAYNIYTPYVNVYTLYFRLADNRVLSRWLRASSFSSGTTLFSELENSDITEILRHPEDDLYIVFRTIRLVVWRGSQLTNHVTRPCVTAYQRPPSNGCLAITSLYYSSVSANRDRRYNHAWPVSVNHDHVTTSHGPAQSIMIDVTSRHGHF